ncbi:MAG: thioredoxin domain-containing protein, partial [Pseudomonadota bacterium]|nr:thioredoxin domain-containing protein [Pseudomonadota bacterium]
MANRLRHETSPYLLQHAHNPVEWQPWDEEALTTAREQDRPILLSIGYSACHWCHVMERESFEDESIAALMNELFVCIKVDREERPDLDRVYQLAHQMLTRRPGGWPLTVVLTPRGHAPFFAGTYFPPEPRLGMPGFADVLRQVAEHYRRNRSRMESHDIAMVEALAQANPRANPRVNPDVKPGAAHRGTDGDAALPPSGLGDAREALAQQYDARYGGFGDAPKFPHPTQIELLLWRWRRSRDTERPDPAALAMAVTTLRRMADGGLFDQLAGGFYRYSVDRRWLVPHFEKMLYDNAQLLPLYADAFLASGDERLREAALMTGEWVMAEMQGGEDGPGGYFSTLDADSEGEEGKYYAWTTAELESLLSDRERLLVRQRFGLAGRPNFEGKWHLNVADSGTGDGGNAGEAELLESARLKLLAARARRVRPGCDDKMLTAWNGLMIKGMARAGVVLGRPDFIDSARRALDFLRGTVWREGRLLATTRNGRSHLPGYLDDYAMLADGAFELCQAAWRDGDLAFVIELTEAML